MDEKKNEELKKKVDEAWKESVKKDKGAGDTGADRPHEEVTFGLFIYGLMMEALIALGEAENPITKKKELNAAHARFIVDTLAMLQQKTKGNLLKEEAEMIDAMLYELRTRYINKTASQEPPKT
jgi:hypothetical protein